ncbi:MAG: Abi family protein [Candidatus Azobacteroides sp.]|nr:Abi family protein [Candidatus Azobacteroides sp.]
MKQATTVEQQIKILANRGMTIDINEEKAKEILSDIGYFRLGFYCFPFETSYPNKKNRTHNYKQGTKFSDIVSLYYFDVDLRNILSRYINRIEINFRTNIIYRVSNQYVHCNAWFADPSVMQKDFIDKLDTELYTVNFKKKPIIKNHHKKYINDKYAPAWKTLEFFTFGSMISLYKNIKISQLKQKISLQYNIRNIDTFENYFRAIVEIRNLCAHGSVLFDHKLSIPLRNGIALRIDNQNKNKLFSGIKILHYFIKKISENRANEMEKEINQLFDKFSNILVVSNIINNSIGRKNF